MSLVKKYVPPPARFLEVGCAAGDIGITFAKMGYTGLMIDFSDEAAKQTTKNLAQEGITEVRFEKQDFNQMRDTEKFDFITMFEVLEHIEEDVEALGKAARLLHDGGLLLFSVPAKEKLWGASDVVVGHVRRYDRGRLIDRTKQSGFDIVELLSYGFPWLNIIRYVRDKKAAKALKKKQPGNKIARTQESGLNPEGIKVPVFEVLFNRYLLWPFMKISSLFNSADLAEGYLCLAQKTPPKACVHQDVTPQGPGAKLPI
jgi:SAM-dependent methyltransferase